jgi:branched-chain amino acid aminotransferase
MSKLSVSDPTMETAAPVDWDGLTFSLTPTKAMYLASCSQDSSWEEGRVVPFGNLSLSPAACVLNYGQGIFEGMKAHRSPDGRILLFRPLENGRRMEKGAKRMCMPPFPPARFVNAVEKVVRANEEFIPPPRKGALYVRPLMLGTGPILGVKPAPSYTFVIFTSPVGPYFKGGLNPIRLALTRNFHRAAPGGTGDTKTICNYAGTMYPGMLARKQGFAEVIYLDAHHNRFIDEVGAANFFCVLDGKLITPALGTILPGITRKSILEYSSQVLGLEVEERDIPVEEALTASEAFCAGTAAVVSPIGSITIEKKEHFFNDSKVGPVTKRLYEDLTALQLGEIEDRFGWLHEVS